MKWLEQQTPSNWLQWVDRLYRPTLQLSALSPLPKMDKSEMQPSLEKQGPGPSNSAYEAGSGGCSQSRPSLCRDHSFCLMRLKIQPAGYLSVPVQAVELLDTSFM